ncbi:MAG: M20 family metallopeptidase [Myxococcota bacterium]
MSVDPKPFVEKTFKDTIVPTLQEYITIPNLSPLFDAEWKSHGHMHRAVKLLTEWVKAQQVPGLMLEVLEDAGRTPLIVMEVPGSRSDDTVLLYGHLDKQPPFEGWEDGLGPFTPVIRNGRLYGRGGADDGYAIFASITAIKALKQQGIPHARCIILIEAAEESGSPGLEEYVKALKARIGSCSLVICLDSGCGNYEQLWSTTSLRGMIGGNLTVSLIKEGIHSGDGSGVVASSFRVLRSVLSRIEDEKDGRVLVKECHVEIPEQRRKQAALAAQVLGNEVYTRMPLRPGVQPTTTDVTELILNRTWRPALSVTGAAGLPPLESAGNVLRPVTAVKLSMRLPPTCDADVAAAAMKAALEKDPPYGAKVTFDVEKKSSGWNAPLLAPWLEKSVDGASTRFFGKAACYMGEGGSIPFMGMLGQQFPQAQFLITGVLGPGSNAHGPNEFLDLPTAEKLTCCVAQVLAEHHQR